MFECKIKGLHSEVIVYLPQHDKTCLRGFRQSETQTSLLSYRDKLENWNFAGSKF